MKTILIFLITMTACYIAGNLSSPLVSTKPLGIPPQELTQFIDSKEVVPTNLQYADREEFWANLASEVNQYGSTIRNHRRGGGNVALFGSNIWREEMKLSELIKTLSQLALIAFLLLATSLMWIGAEFVITKKLQCEVGK